MYFIVIKVSFDSNIISVVLSKVFKKISLSIAVSDYSLKR